MNKMVFIKRAIFWVEVASTFLILCIGIFFMLRLLSGTGDTLDGMKILVEFGEDMISQAIKKSPGIVFEVVVLSVFGLIIWIVSLYYFAQTETEKKWIKYTVPAGLIGAFTTPLGAVAVVVIGLSSQGAGH